MSLLPAPAAPCHTITRGGLVGALTPTGSDKGWIWNITLGDFASSSDFTSLFQFYRPKHLAYTFRLAAGSVTTTANPIVYIARAYSGCAAPGNATDLMQHPYKAHTFTQTSPNFTYSVPWPEMEISAASGSGKVEIKSAWLATSSTSVVYLGAIAWFENLNSTVAPAVTLEERVTFEFCGLR
jgi:hypothetical protein